MTATDMHTDTRLGCWFQPLRACFRVWAPAAGKVEWIRGRPGPGPREGQDSAQPAGVGAEPQASKPAAMEREPGGTWFLSEKDFLPGDRYAYAVDGAGPFPDPASRFQPEGVHAFSQGVDLAALSFRHGNPPLPPRSNRVIYELHVGTFTPEGTFAAAAGKLAYLRDLGVTLVELMPVAAFPGRWNWGYDGVSLFAPDRNYGTPEELCGLIDAAHALGLGVLLDVVYNHLGPDGNYLAAFSPEYFTATSRTPWGDGMNLNGPGSHQVRRFFLENALQWLRDYRCDGLRLDATHAFNDDGDNPFLAQLSREARAAMPEREILLYAEDHRNPNHFCLPFSKSGYALDGVWADDWHHHVRRHVTGDGEGYFQPFLGSLELIAYTLQQGWHRNGKGEGYLGTGSDPTSLAYDNFVIFLQNHDQVGNRPMGERLHHQISPNRFRALTALLLLAPETPLIFMGQEWAASTPFQFFTDHHPELGLKVTEGRRREFAGFSAFRDPRVRDLIPDPQDPGTWSRSKLRWSELDRPEHAAVLRWHRLLLRLRREHAAMHSADRGSSTVLHAGDAGIILYRRAGLKLLACAVCIAEGGGTLEISRSAAGATGTAAGGWTHLTGSEDAEFFPGFSEAAWPIREYAIGEGRLGLEFRRAGAWIAEAEAA
jgi:maltooligosyltrehalose trehalohydrolase